MEHRFLRPIAITVLFFFSWTFLGIYNLAYAIDKQLSQSSLNQPKEQKPEERFEKSIRDVEDTINNLKKVKTHEELQGEKDSLRTKRQEIEGHDAEIRSQFAETEEKIKSLPDEIKQRHKDFVKKYEENLNILRRNLDDIEKAETAKEVKVEVEKAKTFLEKTKPPSRHTPLDPNKLPHRTPEIKKKEPRLKYSSQPSPILLASIGDLQGILTNAAISALPPPTQADLTETIEVQFTQQIKDLSAQLQNNPVKIYEWVRNNIEFVPTYGSIQGADMCLQTKQCNAFDTASLLIALLRASNIPAKYVYGTIEIPIDKVMNWVGGFTDANSALDFIASGGIPVSGLISGGKISAARMEHVWVEAYTGYGPYSGRPSRLDSPKTWLPLDPSFKQYNYTQGIDLQTAVPFDGQGFLNQVKATAIINETEGYVTNVNSTYIQTTLTDYQTQLQSYINQNMPNATVSDVLGKKEIKKQELGILPATLPYNKITTGASYSQLPDNLRHKITFEIQDPNFFITSLSYTASIPELAGKRITLSYAPATASDEQIINSYGGIYSTPAYLVGVKPLIKVDGIIKAIGSAIGLGKNQTINMAFINPSFGSDVVSNELPAGGHHAIILDISSIPSTIPITQRANKLKQIIANGAQFFDDNVIGEILALNGTMYFTQLNLLNLLNTRLSKIADLKHPSEAIVSLTVSVTYSWGAPLSVKASGLGIDVDRDIHSPLALNGDQSKEIQYMLASGMRGSGLENVIFEQAYELQSISAVKALQLANEQGIPIYTVSQNNIAQVLPKLAVSNEIKTDIANAVNAGKVVTVPERNLQLKTWNGIGYIILDPNTGTGAYMISGGLAGGATTGDFMNCLTELAQLLAAIVSVSVWIEIAGFVGAVIDALNNPNSGLMAPLIILAAMGLMFGLIFVFVGGGLLFGIVTSIMSLLLLWASNIAATGNPSPYTLIDDCVSLIKKLFSRIRLNIKHFAHNTIELKALGIRAW